jgi:hypothetical protein
VVTRANGTLVAVLDGQQKIHYRQVVLGRDFGAEVEVTGGLKAGEAVLVRPGDELPEGTRVQIAAQSKD